MARHQTRRRAHRPHPPRYPALPLPSWQEQTAPTRIDLSWTAPGNIGSSPITGCKIEVSPNGASNWSILEAYTGNTDVNYSHTGLSPGVTRYYRVFAINSVGTGPASNIANTTTATDDGMLTVNFGASAGTQRDGVEEGGSYWLSFMLDKNPGRQLTIPLTYGYLDGATAADFADLPATVTFEHNRRLAGVALHTVDDVVEDPGEGLQVSFGTMPACVQVGSWSGPKTVIPVIDDNSSPSLSVANANATERRAFIESFVEEIVVGPGEAKVRYTIPMPQDSRIAGMDAEDVAIPRPVLSTVNRGGPRRTDLRTFRWEVAL